MNDIQTENAALVAALNPVVLSPAVTAYVREIRAHENAQAARHFCNIGLDTPCDCEDCAGTPKYPQVFYQIARQLAAFDAAKREAVTTGEKRVAVLVNNIARCAR